MTGTPRPLWPLHLLTALVMVLLFGGAGGWAAVTRIEGAVIASARWSRDSASHQVQHPTGGRITAILVEEGSLVAAGTPLLQLDDSALRIEAALIATERAALARESLLLRAEESGEWPDTAALPAGDPELAAALQRFAARRAATQEDAARLAARLAAIDAQIAAMTRQRASIIDQSALTADAIRTQSALLAGGLVQQNSLRPLQAQAAALAGEEAALDAALAQAEGQKTSIEQEHARRIAARAAEIAASLATMASRDATLAARETLLAQEIAATTLRGPVEGQVEGVHALAGTDILPPGATALRVVPAQSPVMAEADIPPAVIDAISQGQRVRLTPALRGWRDNPPLAGTVTHVAADPRPHPLTGEPLFRVEIAVSPADLARLPDGGPRAGQPLEAHFLTGDHSVLGYLVAPLARYLAKVFRES